MPTSNDHIRETISNYLEFMNSGNAEAIAALYAEDATVEDPIGTPAIEGRKAIHEFYAKAAGMVKLEATGNPRVAAGEAAFPMRVVVGADHIIEVIDIMVFNDAGLIESMRAFWSAE